MPFPTMPTMPISMAAGLKKSPNFNTVRQKGPAGVNAAISLKPYPTWDFEFSLDHITGHERLASSVVAQFIGTFMATAGGANPFYFTDPQDNTLTGAQFGVGDGTHTRFQLSRNIYGAVDIIQNLNGTPSIYVGGSLTTPTSISSTGVVTFASAPANGAILTWSGSFRYLCRFAEDTIDSTRSFSINSGIDQWMVQSVKFSSEFAPGISTYGIIAAPGGV
jgi:uncharacterized protein (TIGR02217 family)